MRLIIVSNRLPITADKDGNIISSIGGVATGLNSFLRCYTKNNDSYLWVGWIGEHLSKLDLSNRKVSKQLRDLSCYPVKIDNNLMEEFYTGFCNKTLWPILYNLTAYFSYSAHDWEVYQQVNSAFAEVILKIAKPGDIIWIHDYHFLLLPDYLREHNQNLAIGFFLHISFPSFDTFQFLPNKCRTDILNGMLGSDLIGFHTYEYAQNFMKCVTRMIGYDHDTETIISSSHAIRVGVYPMGVDFEWFQEQLRSVIPHEPTSEYIDLVGQYKLILSIDRLDYTKGITNRILAYEKFLKANPQWHKKVILILIAAPSREKINHYQNMRSQIEELVGNINGKFSNINWTPILYQYKAYSIEELISLYFISDIMLVTPIVDGMNLIAKEYIATKTTNPGVLILSETAGAAKELIDAIIINPNSKEEVAQAILYGLEMPDTEKQARSKNMQARVKRYDIIRWGNDFISELIAAFEAQKKFASKFLNNTQISRIINRYAKASRRALFFDYDGTLAPFNKQYLLAAPNKALLSTLKTLSDDPNNQVFIVSGRDKNSLENWLGHLNITMVAEHGVWIKQNDQWNTHRQFDPQLKENVLPILEAFMDRMPGTFIEEKDFSLAWHYRNANPETADRLAQELLDTLLTFTANLELQVLSNNKVIEVKPSGIHKAVVAQITDVNKYDYIIAIGDDTTDEDMFKVLPKHSVTIKIGNSASIARYHISSQTKVVELIDKLANTTVS